MVVLAFALLSACRVGYDPCSPEDSRCTLVQMEAETGTVTAPFQVALDTDAIGGSYILDGNREGFEDGPGQVELSFFLDTDGPQDYHILARVLAPDTARDSFIVSVDGAAFFAYHVASCSHSERWQWTIMNQTSGCPDETSPRVFTLAPGAHTLTFASREGQSAVDQVAIQTLF